MRTILPFALIFVPGVALAAAGTLQGLANQIVNLLNASTALLMLGGVLVFFYGTTSNIFKTAHGEVRDMKNYLIWGIFALFIMFSLWGILSLLQNTLFGSTGASAGGGQSQSSNGLFNGQ